MSASFAGIPALLGNMQYTAGNISGVNAGVQYRDAMRMKNLEAALNIAAQQQQQANYQQQRRDQWKQYYDQQRRMNREEARSIENTQYMRNLKNQEINFERDKALRESLLKSNQQSLDWNKALMEAQTDVGKAQLTSETTRRGQDIGAETARMGQEVTMRGQDLTSQQAQRAQNLTMRGQNLTQAYRTGLLQQREADASQRAVQAENALRMQQFGIESANQRAANALQLKAALAEERRKQTKPVSASEAKELTELEKQAAAGDADARATLQHMGRIAPVNMTPIESQKSGSYLRRAWNAFMSVNPLSEIPYIGEGRSENWRQAYTGYSSTGAQQELQEISRRLADFTDHYDDQGQPIPGAYRPGEREFEEELLRRRQEIMTALSMTPVQ